MLRSLPLGKMAKVEKMYYLKNRYYSTGDGFFIRRDPLETPHWQNLYVYVQSNPINFVDPEGLQMGLGPGWLPAKSDVTFDVFFSDVPEEAIVAVTGASCLCPPASGPLKLVGVRVISAGLKLGGISVNRRGFSQRSISCTCECVYKCGSELIRKFALDCKVTDFAIR